MKDGLGVPQPAGPGPSRPLAGRETLRCAGQLFRHKHPSVRPWAADNQVELVFLPTYGSWLIWIELEFAALRYFAPNGTDHRSHAEQNAAINAYIRWRNSRAEPDSNFAPECPIRGWPECPALAS